MLTLLVLVLAIVLLVSLFLIPVGLPGLWIMIAAAIGFTFLVPGSISWVTIGVVVGLALGAEILEFTLGASFTRKYGGSPRAAWGAIIGGLVGAFVGVPVPIVGPVIGGFLGAFGGALAAEFSRGSGVEASTQAATGAVIGRAVAAAIKVAVGLVVAAWVLVAAVG